MPYKHLVGNSQGDKSEDFKQLPLKPRPGAGKESRVNFQSRSFLSEVQFRTRGFSKSGGSRGVKQARGPAHREAKAFSQRVVIKSRVVQTKGRGSKGLALHIRYLQREGVGIDGREPIGFNSEQNLSREEITNLTKEWGGDRHHFRFIISPEQAQELDLQLYARQLMSRVSDDLDTSLEWLGVTHHNTDNPHIHVTLRGRTSSGSDLVITRDYISRAMRAVAEDIATRELGLRNEFDIQRDIQKSISEQRVTPIDRSLEKEAALNSSRLIDLRISPVNAPDFAIRSRNNRLSRLQYLEGLGLAIEQEVGVWKMDERLIDRLQSLGTRNDIIKLLHRRMKGISPEQEVNFVTVENSANLTIIGQVIHIGLADELYDTRFILVESTNRRIHHVSIPSSNKRTQDIEQGDAVSIRTKTEPLLTKADKNIAEFAATNDGVYSLTGHEAYANEHISLPPGVSAQDYIINHRKRIDSLLRMGVIEQVSSESWKIPDDLVPQLNQQTRSFLTIDILARNQEQQHSIGR